MKKRFTLVELLVIVAVIGILASLLISVMETGIRKIKETQCIDNFRTIGAASMAYSGDNGGFFPVYRYSRPNEMMGANLKDTTLFNAWRFQIGSYIYSGKDYVEESIASWDAGDEKNRGYNITASWAYEHSEELWEGIMRCPMAEGFDNGLGITFESLGKKWADKPEFFRTGYGFSEGFRDHVDHNNWGFYSELSNKWHNNRPVHIARVQKLDETVMAGDTFYSGAPLINYENSFLRLFPYEPYMKQVSAFYNAHGEGINVLWADGRAGFAPHNLLTSKGPNGNDQSYYFDPIKRK